MAWRFNLSFFYLARTSAIMWWLSTGIQSPSLDTKHNRMDSSPPAAKISYTMWAKACTGNIVLPVACCVMVWPIWPLFWYEIFRTERFAVRSTSSGVLHVITTPFQKDPTFSNYKLFCARGTDPFAVLHNIIVFGIFSNPENDIKCHKYQSTNSTNERVHWHKAIIVCFMG